MSKSIYKVFEARDITDLEYKKRELDDLLSSCRSNLCTTQSSREYWRDLAESRLSRGTVAIMLTVSALASFVAGYML